MKRVLLLATTTGYQLRSFGDAARAAGATLTLATDRCDQLEDPWSDRAIAVRFGVEPDAVAAAVAACARARPDGVVAVGDRPAVLAAHLTAALGLEGNPAAAATRSRNKLQAREALRSAGLPTPEFEAVSLHDDPVRLAGHAAFPAVLKPLALSGSRGVIRVNDAAEFIEAFGRLRTLMMSPDIRIERDAAHDAALIESFVAGDEFAVEGALTRGDFQPFAIFDKPDPLEGPFFEESIYLTPSRQPAPVQEAIVSAVARAARALGLRHGPIHAECRVNASGVYVLEVAARPIGGLCARALRFERESGPAGLVSFEEVLLRHALGEDVRPYRREPAASGVMMIPIPQRGVFRGVDGVEAARRVANVDDVRITAKVDTLLVPLPEGHSYLGFIFAHGGDATAVERALREAHAQLRFLIEREVPFVQSG
ncbi:MAG TPA: ATP-grasp domain-containing protein [Vicinamibacterales bacterium]|nr:ATP-grasp domain-containing protein [Vicinamibacterales bacterium]